MKILKKFPTQKKLNISNKKKHLCLKHDWKQSRYPKRKICDIQLNKKKNQSK
jgi:hypothetical protein